VLSNLQDKKIKKLKAFISEELKKSLINKDTKDD